MIPAVKPPFSSHHPPLEEGGVQDLGECTPNNGPARPTIPERRGEGEQGRGYKGHKKLEKRIG